MNRDYMLTFHVNGGQSVAGVLAHPDEEDTELEDVAAAVLHAVSEPERPCWMQLGNVVFFTGAVSAVTVEAILEGDGEQEEAS